MKGKDRGREGGLLATVILDRIKERGVRVEKKLTQIIQTQNLRTEAASFSEGQLSR